MTTPNPASTPVATPPAMPDLDAIRAEADRAATERIASYDPVLAAARGLLPDDQIDAQRQAAVRERVSADVLRGRLWDAFAHRGRAATPTLPANPTAGPASQDPEVIRDAMADNPIRIEGDGTPHRSYLYAADLAIWLWTILFKGESLWPYNVGSEEGFPISKIASLVNDALGGKSSIEIALEPVPSSTPSRYVPAVGRARAQLELISYVSLSESLRRTGKWLQSANAI